MDELIAYMEQSVLDNAFSRGDKRGFKPMLARYGPSQDDLNFLRSKVFDLAMSRVNAENYELVIGWLEEINKTLVPKSIAVEKSQVYFSPGDECLNAILLQLRTTTSTARICVFTISDNRITREIIAAKGRGIDVRVLTDNDKLMDTGSDIEWLAKEGIDVKVDDTSNHMHHKFAIFDKEVLLTGSYNWTRSAASYNHENLLISTEEGVVNEYLKEFDKLWTEMDFFNP